MIRKTILSFAVAALLLASAPSGAAGKGHLVLQLKGRDVGEMRYYDTTGDGELDAKGLCFDVGLYNPATGQRIGSGTDCLDVESESADGQGVSIALTGTGFFHIGGSTLVVQGLTSVRPVLQLTTRDTSEGAVTFTHVTGANGENGVRHGTRRFRNSSGAVRLSGQVDMSRMAVDGSIYFDCLFVVDFY